MRGLLLDPRTGRPEGDAVVPKLGDAQPWRDDLERAVALDRVGQMLRRSQDFKATTTTRAYKVAPDGAAGISRATSGGAWTNSAWTEVIAASSITSTFYVTGVTWMWWTPLAATDTTYEIELAFGTGAGGSETEVLVVPASVRSDTAVGMMPSNFVPIVEPKEIAANARVAVRVRYGTAASVTITGIKLQYSV